MKNKLLVIFFISVFFSILIYNCFHKTNNSILLIGEYNDILLSNKNKNLKTFLYDEITYKELVNSIKNNDYIIVKNKKVYLNQLINNSSYIIVYANNNEYVKKCKNNKITENYKKRLEYNKMELENIIKKISSKNIAFVTNDCDLKLVKSNIKKYIKD